MEKETVEGKKIDRTRGRKGTRGGKAIGKGGNEKGRGE